MPVLKRELCTALADESLVAPAKHKPLAQKGCEHNCAAFLIQRQTRDLDLFHERISLWVELLHSDVAIVELLRDDFELVEGQSSGRLLREKTTMKFKFTK